MFRQSLLDVKKSFGLIGILVAGAINRTNAASGSTEGRGQGRGNGNTTTAYAAGRGQGGGGWGQGSESATGDQFGTGQAQVTE